MRFTILVVATSVAHMRQLQSIALVQMLLCTFSPVAFLNSLDILTEALLAHSHDKLPSCSHTDTQFSLDWSHIATPAAGFRRLQSTKEADHLSEDDTFFFNCPTHSLKSTELFWVTLFNSLAANGRMLSGYLSPKPSLYLSKYSTGICLVKQSLKITILFCVQSSLWKQQEKNSVQCLWVDFS